MYDPITDDVMAPARRDLAALVDYHARRTVEPVDDPVLGLAAVSPGADGTYYHWSQEVASLDAAMGLARAWFLRVAVWRTQVPTTVSVSAWTCGTLRVHTCVLAAVYHAYPAPTGPASPEDAVEQARR